jgi:hypothetical protein
MYQALIDPINQNLKNEFELNLFLASINVLEDKTNPIRYNLFALSLRELTRNILSRLAPDDKVLKCQWYSNETDKENGITRRQRMMFSIKGGLSNEFIQEELNFDLDTISQRMKIVIENLNKYTHIQEETFNNDSQLIDIMAFNALSALNEFYCTIEDIKCEISRAYEARLYKLITETMISDTLVEIDILATHYWVDGVCVDNISVVQVDELNISIEVDGFIEIVHQYGSDMDYEHDDGLRMESSYPFSIYLEVGVENPLDINISIDDIEIDNSKFYE